MRASSPDDVRQLYDTSADHYADMMDAEIELPVYSDTLGRLAGSIAEIPGPVIDTSCGPGHMLQLYHERFDAERPLVGVDLSPRMAAIANARIGSLASIQIGDMRDLSAVESGSAAAVLSFFAIHHIDPDEVAATLAEWHRVLRVGGQLALAAWEGSGPIDYGGESDVVAFRFRGDEIDAWARDAGYVVESCSVEPVEGFPMDAIYLAATKD